MKSMTGFGRSSVANREHGLQISIEISSVNRKSLDVSTSAPREWNGIDLRCSEWIKPYYQRGRVSIQIKAETSASETQGLRLSAAAMDETLQRLRDYAESHAIPFTVDSHLLLNLAKTLKDNSGLPDWRTLEATIEEAFKEALIDIDSMRQKEGEALAKDLSGRIDTLDTLCQTIEQQAAQAVGNYSKTLLERLKQLDLEIDLNDERVLKEIALFADRSDISEEITRLKSHFEQFREFLKSDAACGRKMDFLCQEIHREFNTTGSKSTQIEITRAVIEGKNALERIREQVQNIE